MLSVRLICVGRMREKFYTEAFNEYAKRLSAYCKFECVELTLCIFGKSLNIELFPHPSHTNQFHRKHYIPS